MPKNNFSDRIKSYISVAYPELIIIIAAVFVDLITKFIVDKAVVLYDTVTIIPHFLHIFYDHNYNASFGSNFGLGKVLGTLGIRIFFIILTFAALVLFILMMYRGRGKSKIYRFSLALIVGGAIGNLYDRIVYGYVRDFIQIEYFGKKLFGRKYFATFNIADSCLVIGVFLLIVYFLFIYKDSGKAEEPKSLSTAELNGLSPENQTNGGESKECDAGAIGAFDGVPERNSLKKGDSFNAGANTSVEDKEKICLGENASNNASHGVPEGGEAKQSTQGGAEHSNNASHSVPEGGEAKQSTQGGAELSNNASHSVSEDDK